MRLYQLLRNEKRISICYLFFAGTFETSALDIDKKMTKQNRAVCSPRDTKMQVRIHLNQMTSRKFSIRRFS